MRIPEQLLELSDDEASIENVETKGVTLRDGVRFRVQIHGVRETVDFSLLIWDPQEERHEDFEVGMPIALIQIYQDRLSDVTSFLGNDDEPGSDRSLFDPNAIALAIMDRTELLLEACGFSLNVHITLGNFREMVEIDRATSAKYVTID